MIEWDEYIYARKSGVKARWKPILDEQLKRIELLDAEQAAVYIDEICTEYFDKGRHEIPIQHPKIWGAVLNLWKSGNLLENEKYLVWVYKAMSFNGVYQLLKLEPDQILERVISINPNNNEAKELLFKNHLDTLDFALHELPYGLVIDESICISILSKCDKQIDENPNLSLLETRFGINYSKYKNKLLSWIEYKSSNEKIGFYEWVDKKS